MAGEIREIREMRETREMTEAGEQGVERNEKPQNGSAEEGKRIGRDGEYRGGWMRTINR